MAFSAVLWRASGDDNEIAKTLSQTLRPYPENRVVADAKTPNGMRFEYQYKGELGVRNQRLCRRFAEALSPKLKVSVATMSENNINFGHPCGTCRFGDDPAISVLDRNNRVHEFDNLYVVDASFFPSSSGINSPAQP